MSAVATMPGCQFPFLRERLLIGEHLREDCGVATPRSTRAENGSIEAKQATRGQPGNLEQPQGLRFPFLRELFRRSARGRKSSAASSSQSSQTQVQRQDSLSTAEQQLGRGLGRLDLRSLPRDDGPPTELQARREKFAYFEKKCSEVASNICVGGEAVARNRALLREAGVTHVVNCIGMLCPACFPNDFTYLNLCINDATQEDISSLFYDVFAFMEEALNSGGKVFVHCSQGVSRSASFVIAYLMWLNNQSYDAVYQDVKSIRGVINPNIGFTCQLLNWAKRRLAPVEGCRVYQIARHAQDERYPTYLVAKPLASPTPAVLEEAHSALVFRLPGSTYVWQGSQCPQEYLAAAQKAAAGFTRYEGAPPARTIQAGSEPAELLDALGTDAASRQETRLAPQIKLATVATGDRSRESSAPNSARAKTPREEPQEGPYGLRSPNQRFRKMMRSDSATGPATDRSRSSESETATPSCSPRTQATPRLTELPRGLSSHPQTPRSARSACATSSPRLAYSAHAANSSQTAQSPRALCSPRTAETPRSANSPRTPRSPLAGGSGSRRSPRKAPFNGLLRLKLPLQ